MDAHVSPVVRSLVNRCPPRSPVGPLRMPVGHRWITGGLPVRRQWASMGRPLIAHELMVQDKRLAHE